MPYHMTEKAPRTIIPSNNISVVVGCKNICRNIMYSVAEVHYKDKVDNLWHCKPDGWLPIKLHVTRGSNKIFIDEINHNETIYINRARYFNSAIKDYLYPLHTFGLEPSEMHNQNGSFYLKALNQATVTINVDPDPRERVVDITFFCVNFVSIRVDGLSRMYF